MTYTLRGATQLAIILAAAAPSAMAAPILFSVDTDLSSLSIDPQSGFVPGSIPTSMQGPGSWTANYSGTIFADVTASTIQILPTSTIVAGASGDWSPGVLYPTTGRGEDATEYVNSSAFANYGTVSDLTSIGGPAASNSATRGIQLSLADTAPKLLTGGTFSEVGIQPDFLAGIVYLSYGGTPSISNLAGDGIAVTPTVDTTGEGSLTQSGNLLTLTIPIEFTESHFFSSTTYSGVIVATATVPEPVSASLLLAAMPMFLVTRRRRADAGATV